MATESSNSKRHPYSDLTNLPIQKETYIDWQSVPGEKYWLSGFYPANKREYWHKLDDMTNGYRNGAWQNQKAQTHHKNADLINAVCDQIDLVHRPRERAIALFESINLGKQGQRAEWYAIAVCAYVLHVHCSARVGHPNSPYLDSEIRRMMKSVDMTDHQLRKIYGKVENIARRRARQEVKKTVDGVVHPDIMKEAGIEWCMSLSESCLRNYRDSKWHSEAFSN